MGNKQLEIQEETFFQIKFRRNYSLNHIMWMRLFSKTFGIVPKLIHLYGTKVIIFVNYDEYSELIRDWNIYVKKFTKRSKYNVRIKRYSNNLIELIKNWYSNIKDLKVSIEFDGNKFQIYLLPPSNLRQFIIGKHHQEIKILQEFLQESIPESQFEILVE